MADDAQLGKGKSNFRLDKLNEVFVAAGGYVIACVNHGSVVVNLEDVNW